MLSIKEKIVEIRTYLNDNINNLKKSVIWKIQSTIATNFMPFKEKTIMMHSKNNNTEITTGKQTDKLLNFFHHFFLDIKQAQQNQ